MLHLCTKFQGDRTAPKCGFSRTTVELLDGLDAEYGTFDILTDDAVRQGLKTFSDWPTYPQVNRASLKMRTLLSLDIRKIPVAPHPILNFVF